MEGLFVDEIEYWIAGSAVQTAILDRLSTFFEVTGDVKGVLNSSESVVHDLECISGPQ